MSWICDDCGRLHSKPRNGVATYHNGLCYWCLKEKPVTEDRDYGYPKNHWPGEVINLCQMYDRLKLETL